jgi:hypothetical protein
MKDCSLDWGVMVDIGPRTSYWIVKLDVSSRRRGLI